MWTGAKNLFTDQFYETLSQKTSNPFEQLSYFLGNNDLLSFSTKDITVKIPWITTEDINGYSIYLLEWLEKNQKIMNKRKKIFSSL
ncbi:MAG: hypothetical protein K6E76_05580 [Patescibacteria group bacterium]|nr:hypothetical protein [Patescibacteria group bacterium]